MKAKLLRCSHFHWADVLQISRRLWIGLKSLLFFLKFELRESLKLQCEISIRAYFLHVLLWRIRRMHFSLIAAWSHQASREDQICPLHILTTLFGILTSFLEILSVFFLNVQIFWGLGRSGLISLLGKKAWGVFHLMSLEKWILIWVLRCFCRLNNSWNS